MPRCRVLTNGDIDFVSIRSMLAVSWLETKYLGTGFVFFSDAVSRYKADRIDVR